MNFIKNLGCLILITVFQNTLYHSAAIRMRAQLVNLASESVNDKIEMLGGNTFDYFLYNVVAVLIFDTLKDVKKYYSDCTTLRTWPSSSFTISI